MSHLSPRFAVVFRSRQGGNSSPSFFNWSFKLAAIHFDGVTIATGLYQAQAFLFDNFRFENFRLIPAT